MPPQDPLSNPNPQDNGSEPPVPPQPAVPREPEMVVNPPQSDSAANLGPQPAPFGGAQQQPTPMGPPPQPSMMPAANPIGNMPPQPVSSANAFGAGSPKGKKKKIVVLVVAIVILLGLVFGGLTVAKKFLSSIKLEAYSNEDFSLQVPVGYEKEENSNGVQFKEKGPEDTRSGLIAFYQDFPGSLSDDELKELRELLKDQLESSAKSFTEKGQEVEDLKITDTKHNGNDALELTATVTKDGKKTGEVKLIAALTKDEMYIVGVAVHSSDPGLKKKIDTIINSFQLK